MNKENLKAVIDHIKAHPETWDQQTYHCGSTHCLAGHAQIMSGMPENNNCAHRDAREWLGLSDDEADRLFNGNNTIPDLEEFIANAGP